MFSVACRDVGVDCDYKGTGETEEQLMDNLINHAIKINGYSLKSDEAGYARKN